MRWSDGTRLSRRTTRPGGRFLRTRHRGIAVAILVLLSLSFVGAQAAAGTRFKTFRIPTTFCFPWDITAGSDGNLWFTESATAANKIGRITPTGLFSEFSIPTLSSTPMGIIAGPDGNVWFVENGAGQVGRITPIGVISEFPLSQSSDYPIDITAGPDGNLWFTEWAANSIGRMSPSGDYTEFSAAGQGPTGITAGPDRNIWFTLGGQGENSILRMTTAGVVTGQWDPPTPHSYPTQITVGPDGNLWFTENRANRIGRIAPSGHITEFRIPVDIHPIGIAAGSDGNLWFGGGDMVGKITTFGVITMVGTEPGAGYAGATAGPFGTVWFVEKSADAITALKL